MTHKAPIKNALEHYKQLSNLKQESAGVKMASEYLYFFEKMTNDLCQEQKERVKEIIEKSKDDQNFKNFQPEELRIALKILKRVRKELNAELKQLKAQAYKMGLRIHKADRGGSK